MIKCFSTSEMTLLELFFTVSTNMDRFNTCFVHLSSSALIISENSVPVTSTIFSIRWIIVHKLPSYVLLAIQIQLSKILAKYKKFFELSALRILTVSTHWWTRSYSVFIMFSWCLIAGRHRNYCGLNKIVHKWARLSYFNLLR